MIAARRLHKAGGFTLIELLVVVAVVAILSAIAIPIFLDYQANAFDARANSDLRNAANAEEAYFLAQGSYLSCSDDQCVTELPNFRRSATVAITITAAGPSGSEAFTGVATSDRGRRTFVWNSATGGMNN